MTALLEFKQKLKGFYAQYEICLLYTSDAADD